jgi:NAD(P)H-hydrate epimerase
MAVIDENSASLGLPTSILMENAGANVAKVTDSTYHVQDKTVVVVAGTGNNGGDGFVAARHLLNSHARVRLALLGRCEDIKTQEARLNWDLLSKTEVDVERQSIRGLNEIIFLRDWLESSDLVLDAILGTGVKGSLREPIPEVVKLMNDSGRPIVAVDTPTGLNPSTGEVQGSAVKADLTVTFHKMKKGFQGKEEFTGKVIVADIGIPVEAELFTGPGDVRRVVKPRNVYAHKGDFGYVLIIGGSAVYSGAPALAGMAALRCGAGLAIIATTREVVTAVRAYSPNLIVHSLDHDVIATTDLPRIRGLLEKCDAIVLGPGIGVHRTTSAAIRQIIVASVTMKKPMIIDADALRALDETATFQGARLILTPHAGEFKSMSGVEPPNGWKDRARICVEFAKRRSCVLLLKGHDTVVTDGYNLKINQTGNPGMATGGSGDVLSGIIGALLAQGNSPYHSGTAAAFIHGMAGDLAVKRKGFHIVATDIIDEIPSVMKQFDSVA